MSDKINVAILGASGYTGAELVRMLALHPRVRIAALTADRKAGQSLASVFPHLALVSDHLPDLVAIDGVDWSGIDMVFCGLPHGTTQEVIAGLPAHMKVVDLSADFRLTDLDTYAKWYGHEHKAPDLQKEAVYGLTEIYREQVAGARLVANPGCYTTCAELPLFPLLKAGLISKDDIIIDAKSGATGAGRGVKESSLFAEVSEGFHAYAVGSHRHGPEIEQCLSDAAGSPIMVTFTPHLLPQNRGILSTIYVKLNDGADAETLREELSRAYAGEPFVRVLPTGGLPQTRHVRGSNFCVIGVVPDRVPGRVVLVAAIDNLVKGASGQAIQNMNVMMGFPETMALEQLPMFP